MSHPNLAHVTVDGKSSSAVIFKGNPTDFDNEIFFLVEVQGSGTFLIDVEGEKYRLTAANEYVHLPGGVWLKHPMTDGKFVEPKWSKGTMALVDSNGRSIEVNP